MPETKIQFPDPSKLGLFFGPKGKTIKDLQDRTNTKIIVQGSTIIISARDRATLDKAVLVVQNKINTLHAGYSHPEVAYSVLVVPSWCAKTAMFTMEPYNNNATSMIAMHKKQMYVPALVLLKKSTEEVEQLLANMSLSDADVQLRPSQFVCTSNENALINVLAKEFAAAALKEYKAQNGKTIFFDSFSLRLMVSLGRVCLNTARNIHPMFSSNASISVKNLCQLQVGLEKDYKMTYMPIIGAEHAKQAEAYLNDAKYIKKDPSPVIVSVHCQNQETSCNYTVTLLIDSKSSVIALKKICTEALKPLFCQMLHYGEQAGATTVDSRLRIDTECKNSLVTSMTNVGMLPDSLLKQFLAAISWSSSKQELVVPKIANFAIDTIRYKQCNAFVKDGIKASIYHVREHGLANDSHVELTIKCQKVATLLASEQGQVTAKITSMLQEVANIQKCILPNQ